MTDLVGKKAMTSKSLVFHQYIGFSNHDDPCSKNSTKLTVWCTKTMPLFVCLYRYFSIFVCHNKMNNKIKGFMENVGFVSFVLTWPKLFQPFQLHKSNWAYVVNTKFTSKKRNLAINSWCSLRVTSKCYVIDNFTVVGLVS